MAKHDKIKKLFEKGGGVFCTPLPDFRRKVEAALGIVFDWDGVFNKGEKHGGGSSPFNEVDSMGTNLFRFAFWMKHQNLPTSAIISGENNESATIWSQRESFHAAYSKMANKPEAIQHLCEKQGIAPEQLIYIFDDVLDLPVAEIVGVRLFIPRTANPLLNKYVIDNGLADYCTGASSGNYAVREACELLMGMLGVYEEALSERIKFSEKYSQFLAERNSTKTVLYTKQNNRITTLHP